MPGSTVASGACVTRRGPRSEVGASDATSAAHRRVACRAPRDSEHLRIPDPNAIEQQKAAYARSLDEQLAQAMAACNRLRFMFFQNSFMFFLAI